MPPGNPARFSTRSTLARFSRGSTGWNSRYTQGTQVKIQGKDQIVAAPTKWFHLGFGLQTSSSGTVTYRMADFVLARTRSRMMAAVRSKDTGPELTVRAALFSAGHRYRLHRRDLPGAPDIVLPRFRTVVFVHGCFWHGHDCARGRRPASNLDFWNKKLDQNAARDRRNQAALRAAGWHVVVIWECTLATSCRRLLRRLDHRREDRRPRVDNELTR